MPSVLGGGLNFRMGVVGFFPCTENNFCSRKINQRLDCHQTSIQAAAEQSVTSCICSDATSWPQHRGGMAESRTACCDVLSAGETSVLMTRLLFCRLLWKFGSLSHFPAVLLSYCFHNSASSSYKCSPIPKV